MVYGDKIAEASGYPFEVENVHAGSIQRTAISTTAAARGDHSPNGQGEKEDESGAAIPSLNGPTNHASKFCSEPGHSTV